MSKKTYQIPFAKSGNMQGYPESWWEGEFPNAKRVGPEWRDNFEFKDTLRFVEFWRGRSSAIAIMYGDDGAEYQVFLSDLATMMPHFVNGKVTGTFTFCKKGQNYGCKLVDKVKDNE